jgi:hypothetical protein
MQQQGRYLQVNMLQLRCSRMALLLPAATFETRAISLSQLYDISLGNSVPLAL